MPLKCHIAIFGLEGKVQSVINSVVFLKLQNTHSFFTFAYFVDWCYALEMSLAVYCALNTNTSFIVFH